MVSEQIAEVVFVLNTRGFGGTVEVRLVRGYADILDVEYVVQ